MIAWRERIAVQIARMGLCSLVGAMLTSCVSIDRLTSSTPPELVPRPAPSLPKVFARISVADGVSPGSLSHLITETSSTQEIRVSAGSSQGMVIRALGEPYQSALGIPCRLTVVRYQGRDFKTTACLQMPDTILIIDPLPVG